MAVKIHVGDCLEVLRGLPDDFRANCCVTSPPYWGLRDYGHNGQIGLEPTPSEYVAKMVEVFGAVRDRLAEDGTLWLNLGDSYASSWPCQRRNEIGSGSLANGKREARPPRLGDGLKDKDLVGMPWRVAFALQAAGWYLRSDIIWSKPNPMPESVTDRPTKAHEYIFLLSKSGRYHYDHEALKEQGSADSHGSPGEKQRTLGRALGKSTLGKWPPKPIKMDGHIDRRKDGFNQRWNESGAAGQVGATRNKRSVWEVATQPFSEAHFATFPPALIEPCIKAGCPEGGVVLDPFGGAGTTGLVADRLKRHATLIELNAEYAAMAERRIRDDSPMFADVGVA